VNWEGHRAFFVKCTGLEGKADAAVIPDRRELWASCSKRHRGFYMTPSCPPPPPYHHRLNYCLKASMYYARLARKHYLAGLDYAVPFGIFTHFLADCIIEPLSLEADGIEWEYRVKAGPVSEAALKVSAKPMRPSLSVEDQIAVVVPLARTMVQRGRYEEGVRKALAMCKRVWEDVRKGRKNAWVRAEGLLFPELRVWL